MTLLTNSREQRELASEMKFLISPEVAAQIRAWARSQLAADPNASGAVGDQYQITSLYFDSEGFDVFHRNGSFGRSKYRIRRYGDSSVVFLERKLRTKRLLAKRRSVARLDELPRLAEMRADKSWSAFWFHRRILKRCLSPVCMVLYQRTARVAMTQYGPIRLTLDEKLRAVPAIGLEFGIDPANVLLPDQTILELKFRCALPLMFKNLAEEFALKPVRFSKYRFAAAALHLVDSAANEVTIQAGNQHA